MDVFNKHMEKKIIFSYDITLSCNLRCTYCYNKDILDNKQKYNPEVTEMVIEKIAQFRKEYPDYTFEMDLLGGDPLVADHLWDFLDRVMPLGIDLWIVTNLMQDRETLAKAKEYLNKYERLGIAATWHSNIDDEQYKKNVLFFKDAIKPYWSQADEVWYDNFITSFVLFNDNPDMYNKANWCIDNDIMYGLTVLYHDQMTIRTERYEEWSEETKFVWRNGASYKKMSLLWNDTPISFEEYEERRLYEIAFQYNTVCHPLNWHIDYNGNVYTSCNYSPTKRYRLEEGLHPMKLPCANNDCKCSWHGCKYLYGERK